MPINDYKCETCGIVFEFSKIRSDEVVECPKCQERDGRKLIKQLPTGTSFSLQGTGWYRDSYRGKNSKRRK